jgi:hypothetical protein
MMRIRTASRRAASPLHPTRARPWRARELAPATTDRPAPRSQTMLPGFDLCRQLPSCRMRTQIDVHILFLHGDTFVVSHMSTGHPESGTEEADFRRHRCLCVRVKRECESAGAQCAHAAGTMLVTDVNCGLKSALGCAVVCLRGP